MGLRNRKKETLDRLNSKTLDAQFIHKIQHRLNCSPFEAQAVLDVAKDGTSQFLSGEPPQVHGVYDRARAERVSR